MLFSGAKPTQARKTFSSIARCLESAFTTGVPLGTRGAFVRYDSNTETGCSFLKRFSSRGPLISMRVESSAMRHMSRISGAASSESSHVLCITIVDLPPMKISLVYSSIALLLSPTYGTYLITTTWSGCSPGLYKSSFDATMSSTTLLFEISLDLKHWGEERFMPSLFPRWLYETMLVGLIPAPTRKSTRTLFIFVWPDLKSSPPIKLPSRTAASIKPGTNVFCGEPLMKGTPSSTHARAYNVEGDTSSSSFAMDVRSASSVSFKPAEISPYRSVFAVQSTTTLSTPDFFLKSSMSARIWSIFCCFVPPIVWSALCAWLGAMN
mmetsp:Transcript_6551/g.24714  ORF Transcript_6551/g.24714 Transcript_6551/m.24714 type:complete len:323 (+) Transcript_6551:170-1138(+)